MRRRSFLALGAGLAPLAGLSLRQAGWVRRMLQRNGYAIDAETPLDLLSTWLTPNDLFFVRHHWQPTLPDPKAWRLLVDGEASTPLRLSLAELRQLPRISVTCVLQCAGNGRSLQVPAVPGVQWGLGAVGNAEWTGVRVRDILERAGLKASARHLHTFGADSPPGKVPPFHRSLEIEKARADAIIAWEMNGAPLPALHGAPARLVVPGWAGDHWMKWLDRLSPQPAPQTGFYMDVAYRFPKTPGEPGTAFKPDDMSPVTEIFVKSNITAAPIHARVGKAETIRGFAFSGAPDIARVEISDDGGARWRRADLGKDHDPYAWRFWSFGYTPKQPGKVTLHARATDSRGSVQPKQAVWNPSGYFYNAWHSTEIEVSA